MTKTFTQNDVIRYVYEETSEEENRLIEEALMGEPELMGFFLDTLELRALMDKIDRAPRPSVLNPIFAYSSSFHPNSSVCNPTGVA